MLDTHANKDRPPEEWDREALRQAVLAQFGLDIETLQIAWDTVVHDELRDALVKGLLAAYEAKEKQLGPFMREFERMILLQVIDSQWKDHLLEMDHLKEGIGLRGYGQKDPLIEYKKEGFEMFQSMLDRIEEDAVRYLFLIQPVIDQPAPVRRQTPVYYQQPQGPSGQRARQARAMIPGKRHKH
jgi:preprotein translocase subunit SecA